MNELESQTEIGEKINGDPKEVVNLPNFSFKQGRERYYLQGNVETKNGWVGLLAGLKAGEVKTCLNANG